MGRSLILYVQDQSGAIEPDELDGFLKDLLELIKQVMRNSKTFKKFFKLFFLEEKGTLMS
jgi:hypothetical protein